MGWLRSKRPDEAAGGPVDRLAAITPGVPGHCPACDGLGYIDNIDLGHRCQIQHCRDCGNRWEYLFDEAGAVVGLTELDEHGRPRSRNRIRPLRAPGAAPHPLAAPADTEAAAPNDEVVDVVADVIELAEERRADEAPGPPVHDVIDLRDPDPAMAATSTVEPASAPEHMSPAEWLRHSLRR